MENLLKTAPHVLLWVMLLAFLPQAGVAQGQFERDLGEYEHFDVHQRAIPVRQFSFEHDDDLDYDRQPDDWIRRKGIEFRKYVSAEIDSQQAASGKKSLRMDANGSGAIYYSPPLPIDAHHTYVMEASILTRGLKYDAAMVSYSFLDQKKQRIERILTPPVSGTHVNWTTIKLPPVVPAENVRFVVIGCHLVPSSKRDLHGSAWFDNLSVKKLPRLSLASNFEMHFRETQSQVAIHSSATGLDRGPQDQPYRYELQLKIEDVDGQTLAETIYPLEPDEFQSEENRLTVPVGLKNEQQDSTEELLTDPSEEIPSAVELLEEIPDQLAASTVLSLRREKLREVRVWELPRFPPGFYRVRASLSRNQQPILRKATSFAVLNLHRTPNPNGEFGWTLAGGKHQVAHEDLLAITRESGINWIKVPVWQEAYSQGADQTGQLLTALRNQAITPVGMLFEPPEIIRQKYAENWTGISELFLSPPSIWRDSANEVMALYSPTVTRWQLGDDHDASFVGLPTFDQTMENIRSELQRIGQIRQMGVRWNAGAPVPGKNSPSRNFLTLPLPGDQAIDQIQANVAAIHDAGYEVWGIVQADRQRDSENPYQRANELVRRMVDAKRSGCDRILAYDVFDPELGLLEKNGAPTELFLPWRTAALSLNHSQYAGSILLPGRSTNHVFFRNQEATLVLWNEDPIIEEIYLGDRVVAHTVWGDRHPLKGDVQSGRQKIPVNSAPLILTGCSKELMQWRMNVRFEKGRIASSMAEHDETLLIHNTFPWAIQGSVRMLPESGWEVLPEQIPVVAEAGEEVALPITVKLPSRAGQGEQLMALEFQLGGTGLSYPFRVYSEYVIGLGDLQMDYQLTRDGQGGVIVEQIVTNKTDPAESLDLRCHLLVRGQRRQTRNRYRLLSGQSATNRYLIPNFDDLPAKELWLRIEQQNGRRTINALLSKDQVQLLLQKSEAERAENSARFSE